MSPNTPEVNQLPKEQQQMTAPEGCLGLIGLACLWIVTRFNKDLKNRTFGQWQREQSLRYYETQAMSVEDKQSLRSDLQSFADLISKKNDPEFQQQHARDEAIWRRMGSSTEQQLISPNMDAELLQEYNQLRDEFDSKLEEIFRLVDTTDPSQIMKAFKDVRDFEETVKVLFKDVNYTGGFDSIDVILREGWVYEALAMALKNPEARLYYFGRAFFNYLIVLVFNQAEVTHQQDELLKHTQSMLAKTGLDKVDFSDVPILE